MYRPCNIVLDLPDETIKEIAELIPGRKRGGEDFRNLIASSKYFKNDLYMYPCTEELGSPAWYLYNGTEFKEITKTKGRAMLKRWREPRYR